MLRYGELKRLNWRGTPSEKWYVRVSRLNDEGRIASRSWRCTGFGDRELAEAIVHRWQMEAIIPVVAPPAPVQVIDRAVEEWRMLRSLGRSRNYARLLGRLAREWRAFWGRRPCGEITTSDICAYVSQRTAAGVHSSTINLELRCLRMFFSWAVEQGYARDNPVRRRMVLPAVVRAPRVLTEEEEGRLLDAAASISDRAYGYVLCLLETGFRGGLADRVRWEHVDIAAGLWRIPGAYMKGRRDYAQPIAPKLMAWLQAHARPAGKIWSLAYRQTWLDIRNRAGLPDLHRHDLRRTFVTRCRQAGVPVEVTMALSDHRDVGVMMRIYRAVDGEETRRALETTFGRVRPCATAS